MTRGVTIVKNVSKILVAGCFVLASLGLSACGTNQSQSAQQTANVAYAGSLQLVNDTALGPAFTKATGIPFHGRGGGSFAVAQLIASGEITPSVFESVGTAPFDEMGSKKQTWAIGFASSPLVIAYSQSSPYAAALNAIATGKKPLRDLFPLLETPGFHLGRTNPDTDPQGQAFILMMHLAEQQLHLPIGTADKIIGSNNNPKQVFAEEAILSTLQSGQLDATSAYLPEAIQHHLSYISLPATVNLGDPADAAIYATASLRLTSGKLVHGKPIEIYVTTVPHATDAQAGGKFVAFLLSSQGLAFYQKNGFDITKFIVHGNPADIPAPIQSAIGR